MSRARAAGAVLTALLATGCTTAVSGTPLGTGSADDNRDLVTGYYAELNDAGEDGPTTQRDFLRRTQHPDFTDRLCDLRGLTLEIEPAMSTLRLDSKWKPDAAEDRPRGTVYALGVFVSVRRDGSLLAEQISSQRVVVLEGRVYGFMACLND